MPTQISVIIDSLAPEVRPAAVFMANTGLRIGSVLATRTEWIDKGRRQVNYPAGVMKARRKHTVDLNDSAWSALAVAIEHSDDPGCPFPFGYWFVYRRWKATMAELTLDGVTPHNFRHSFVSNQLDAGTPIHVVRDLAGHASIVTTQLYAQRLLKVRKRKVSSG